MNNPKNKQGKVILIGAGPGDVGLLTLQGKHWLQKAEVIFYDHLVNEDLLRFTQKETEVIYVGKKEGIACALSRHVLVVSSARVNVHAHE